MALTVTSQEQTLMECQLLFSCIQRGENTSPQMQKNTRMNREKVRRNLILLEEKGLIYKTKTKPIVYELDTDNIYFLSKLLDANDLLHTHCTRIAQDQQDVSIEKTEPADPLLHTHCTRIAQNKNNYHLDQDETEIQNDLLHTDCTRIAQDQQDVSIEKTEPADPLLHTDCTRIAQNNTPKTGEKEDETPETLKKRDDTEAQNIELTEGEKNKNKDNILYNINNYSYESDDTSGGSFRRRSENKNKKPFSLLSKSDDFDTERDEQLKNEQQQPEDEVVGSGVFDLPEAETGGRKQSPAQKLKKSTTPEIVHQAYAEFWTRRHAYLKTKGITNTFAVTKRLELGQKNALKSFFKKHPDVSLDLFCEAIEYFLQHTFFRDKTIKPKNVCDWFDTHFIVSPEAHAFQQRRQRKLFTLQDVVGQEDRYFPPEVVTGVNGLLEQFKQDELGKRNDTTYHWLLHYAMRIWNEQLPTAFLLQFIHPAVRDAVQSIITSGDHT